MMHGNGCKCWGVKKLVVGVLVLLNAFVWPQWLGIDGWIQFFAVLMIIGGVLMLVVPPCKSCAVDVPATKGKKK